MGAAPQTRMSPSQQTLPRTDSPEFWPVGLRERKLAQIQRPDGSAPVSSEVLNLLGLSARAVQSEAARRGVSEVSVVRERVAEVLGEVPADFLQCRGDGR